MTSCLAPKGLESASVRGKKHSTPLNHLCIVLCLQAVFPSQCYGKPQIHVPLKEEREGRKEGERKEKGRRKFCKVKAWIGFGVNMHIYGTGKI